MMLRWNIYFTMKGPGGILEVPNNSNPVESPSLACVLVELPRQLPEDDAIELRTIGIRVELVDDA